MPATKRRPQSALIRRLIDRPQQFQFFQAVRLIELWLRRGGKTLGDVLRFKNSVSLSFPASQIEALSVESDGNIDANTALHIELAGGPGLRIRLTPAFMGFLGVSGVLPYYYTGVIGAQILFDKNESGRAFLDSFSHRPMTLFYRAWEKCRVEYRLDGNGNDGFLPIQLALAGISPSQPAITAAGEDSTIAAEVAAHYAALIRHRPASAAMIVGVLNDYFGLPFRLEQFVGGWETLRPDEQTCLSRGNWQLGLNAMTGERYWRRDLCTRLWIGPLSRAEFEQFLPDASGAKSLKALLALFTVPNLRFEVCLILRAGDALPMRLDGSCQLGHAIALATEPVTVDYDGMRYPNHF